MSGVWQVCFLLALAWNVRRGLTRLRQHDLAHLGHLTFPEVARTSVPGEALAFFEAHPLDRLGLRRLGVLAAQAAGDRVLGFVEVWIDPTHTVQGQLVWTRAPGKRRTKPEITFSAHPADRTAIRELEVSSAVFGLTPGDRAGTETVRLPGASPEALIAVLRRRAASYEQPLLACPDLRSIGFLMERSAALTQEWRMATGRLELTPEGVVRFSWRQCLWFARTHDRLLVLLWCPLIGARTRQRARGWPTVAPANPAVRLGPLHGGEKVPSRPDEATSPRSIQQVLRPTRRPYWQVSGHADSVGGTWLTLFRG